MAVVTVPSTMNILGKEEDKDKRQMTVGPMTGAPGAGGTIAARAPTPGAVGPISGPSAPGRFANIRAYIKAGQPETEALGRQVESKLGQQAAAFRAGAEAARGGAEEAAAGERTRLGGATSRIGELIGKAGITAPAATPPTAGTTPTAPTTIQQLSEAEEAELARFFSGTRQKFDATRATEGLTPELQRLQQLQQQLGTEAGTADILQRTVARPGYAPGRSKLSQMLLRSSPDVLRQIQEKGRLIGQEAGKEYQEAVAGIGDIESELGKLAGEAQTEIERLTTSEVGGLETGLEDLRSKLELERQQQADVINTIREKIAHAQTLGEGGIRSLFESRENPFTKERITKNILTPKEMKVLGITEDTRIGELDLNQLLSSLGTQEDLATTAKVSAIQAMTPEQQARYLALQRIAGLSPTLAGKVGTLNIGEGTEVGKLDPLKLYEEETLRSSFGPTKESDYRARYAEHEREKKELEGIDKWWAEASAKGWRGVSSEARLGAEARAHALRPKVEAYAKEAFSPKAEYERLGTEYDRVKNEMNEFNKQYKQYQNELASLGPARTGEELRKRNYILHQMNVAQSNAINRAAGLKSIDKQRDDIQTGKTGIAKYTRIKDLLQRPIPGGAVAR